MSGNHPFETAKSIICQVLESAAFIFAQPWESGKAPDFRMEMARGASLEFAGPHCGVFRIWADNSFCRYAAANMLGLDESDDEAARKGFDALKELLNIMVGNFLTAFYGTQPAFELGLPRERVEGAARDARSEQALWFEAEGNFLLVTAEIDG
jgi:hypothetical protein